MKKVFYLLFLISAFSNAQFKRGFVKSEIHFKNDEILSGYIYDDFAQNDWYGKGDFERTKIAYYEGLYDSNLYSAVSDFQTIIKTINYKQNENDGQQLDIHSDSIKFIIVSRNGDIQKYITTKVVRSNFKNDEPVKFDTLMRNIWLPIKKEGKINMHGFYMWKMKERNGWAEVYFQRNGEEYAINPVLSHKSMLGLKPQRLQIKASLLKIFNDCEKFKQNIESIVEEYIIDFHDAKKISKEEREFIKSQPKEKQERTKYEIREKESFIPSENILSKYYSYCGE